jgi:hypothetical protein
MAIAKGDRNYMNGRTIARVLLVLILVGGAAALGIGAYNAGVTQGLIDSGQVAPGGYIGGPYVGGWGYGWGHGIGFGFFGFLGTLLFILLLVGLLRAAFGRGRGWGPGGPRGWYGPDGQSGRDAWHERVRRVHDELHGTGTGMGGTGTGGSTPNDPDRPNG